MNNTTDHISDQASTVVFNPSSTDWPTNIINVQSALAELGGWCQKSKGLPVASQNVAGSIMIATLEEANVGTSQTKAITPYTMKQVLKKPEATESVYGTTKYANSSERVNINNNVTTITPLGLDYVFNNRRGTESTFGSAKIATKSQAETGNDDNVVMTPLKTKQAIAVHVKPVALATESSTGISKMATIQEIQAGVAREGVSISPYGFANSRGTRTSFGTLKVATGADIINGTAEDKAVSPKALFEAKGSVSNYGIVALARDVSPNHPNHALAANANVLPSTGGIMTGWIQYANTGSGIRWDFNTDNAYITFHSTGDNDPDTRMEFMVGDNHTEYFTWKSTHASGDIREIMRATPDQKLWVYNGIYDRGHLVYSPLNLPSPETLGALRNQWGATQITGYLNDFDREVNYEVPYGHVMVGLYSYHQNAQEDRRWRVRYRSIG